MSQNKKVDRLIEKYDLRGLPQELISQREKGVSYRELADVVNTHVVREATRDTPLSVQETLDVLNEDAISGYRRVKSYLNDAGYDLNELKKDLISHTSVRKYIITELDVDEPNNQESENYLEIIDWALHRAEVIAERQITRMDNDGRLQEGLSQDDVDVNAVIRLYDTSGDTNQSITLNRLLEDNPNAEKEDPDSK